MKGEQAAYTCRIWPILSSRRLRCARLRSRRALALRLPVAAIRAAAYDPMTSQDSGLSSQRNPGERLDGACRGDVLFPAISSPNLGVFAVTVLLPLQYWLICVRTG